MYVDQRGSGKRSGSSCRSARPIAWLGDPRHWGPRGRIRPGTVIELCGTISSPVRIEGSGARGHPITLHFQPGAEISLPVCPRSGAACLNTGGQHYITIDGGRNGVVQSYANGSDRPLHVQDSLGVWALNCDGCVIENLTVRDMYVHTSPSDTAGGGDGIIFSGRDLTIRNNILHDDHWALVAEWQNGDGGARIYGNRIYRIDHGFASTARGGVQTGSVYFYRNHVYDYANWDTFRNAYHHDGVHCYSFNGGAAHYRGLYIYDNRFGGTTGVNITAQVFLEGGPDGTPCADSTTPIYIFDNVFSATAAVNDGMLVAASGQPRVYNNTLIGHDRTGICYATNSSATNGTFQNNLVTSCGGLMYNNQPGVYAAGNPDHNLYAGGGDNAFVCGHNYYAFRRFRSWKSCIGGDYHSRITRNARLNAAGAPSGRSAAVGVGANLSALCRGPLSPLCATIDGRRRPGSGPWTAGAY